MGVYHPATSALTDPFPRKTQLSLTALPHKAYIRFVADTKVRSKAALPQKTSSATWAILSDSHFLVPAAVLAGGILLLIALS
jgi:hypothetical protein